ncbi:hypothetical protein VdG1_09374 [Verticillium dahliae VDG1]|nr:hypothetical protein VdG1_09374 [Verticillium dahliae VDG1]
MAPSAKNLAALSRKKARKVEKALAHAAKRREEQGDVEGLDEDEEADEEYVDAEDEEEEAGVEMEDAVEPKTSKKSKKSKKGKKAAATTTDMEVDDIA